jgi:ferritin
MIKPRVEAGLNRQIQLEAQSSQFYLAMASWAETSGYGGTAQFLFGHSDEERMHMLKLVHFVNERGGNAVITDLEKPPEVFDSLESVFKQLLAHEIKVSEEINGLVDICMEEKDYATQNFLQWYVAEQIEEEALARTILDKLKLIGSDRGGLYLFDRDLENMDAQNDVTV